VPRRVAIVTGAASGLGRAMARGLAAAGHDVAAVDLTAQQHALDALAADCAAAGTPGRLASIAGSVRSAADCARIAAETVARFGTVDVLVNNAGLGMAGISPDPTTQDVLFYNVPVEKWIALVDTNVNGPFLMAHAVTPRFVERGWGRIVNVTTNFTTMLRYANSPYGTAKAALEASTLIWSKDLTGTGVTVNALIPGGPADTSMIAHIGDRATLLPPDIMVPPLRWLVSDEADGITGKRFVARTWDPAAPTAVNVATSSAPAAWGP
jgi:3-oxoacyl-[acyl-carrier protein] reductase